MKQLTKTDRREIQEYLHKGHGVCGIARMLRKHPSTISREIKRNSTNGEYDSKKAHHKSYTRRYWVTKERPKIEGCAALKQFIEDSLRRLNSWSPEQIAGRWNKLHKKEHGISVTHTTIYNYLYKYRLDLCRFLCSKRTKKKKHKRKTKRQMIPNRVWIDDRPKVVDEKRRIGDFEGDTISSIRGDKTRILVVHDRFSRYIIGSKSCDARPARIAQKVKKMTAGKTVHTLTLDNGIEFKHHEKYGTDNYFCHPYSSWQKGAVEYSNRLIRRHFPKKYPLHTIHQKRLASIVKAINNTPRKCLNFSTPYEVFSKLSPEP